MSAEALTRFVKRLAVDETRQERLVAFGSRRGLAPGRGKLSESAIADFAVKHGFLVTADDLRGRSIAQELSNQSTAPLTVLPTPGSKLPRPSAEW